MISAIKILFNLEESSKKIWVSLRDSVGVGDLDSDGSLVQATRIEFERNLTQKAVISILLKKTSFFLSTW